uniref:Uncharacterized protein n=1 Tax=Lepeophtheirus salmonis TaxID=72036 RepID=A0A0K2TLC9_LEPSM
MEMITIILNILCKFNITYFFLH